MLQNYFKIEPRNLSKQKALAFINIFGLSTGIACFSLFMLYAVNEFSFDSFNKKQIICIVCTCGMIQKMAHDLKPIT